ncbi:MAG: hypothetical protein ACO1SV_16425 [Fimbriimonas sp.]
MHIEHLRKRALEELALLSDYYRENEEIDLDFVYIHTLTLLEHLDAMKHRVEDFVEAELDQGAA